MASIVLENVVKRYGRGPEAVKGISLAIGEGAFVTLVGPSGCGKSTLLNLIAGLEEPTAGTIRFDGEVVNDRPPGERDVAMVFQSYALYPHKSVYENMAFPLRVARAPRDEIDRRVREAAARLEIAHLLDRRPRDLSGGQRQRVALGRALVRRPRAFLLDEPLSNLDAALRVQMRAEIKRLHADLAATFVYVTHDQAEALTLSDEVVVLRDGRVEQVAPPREVYERPANVFVARFLGSPPINLIEGRAAKEAIETAAGRLPLPAGRVLSPAAVLVGVRPEAARVALGEARPGTLAGRVYVVEPLGAETLVTVALDGGGRVACRAEPGFAARPGDRAAVEVAAEAMHFFDPRTEKRIVEP
jgi:multiple sugar transport system ATP-binding protein